MSMSIGRRGGTGESGGSIVVPDSMRFTTTTDRNDYFTTNSSKLKLDAYCTVSGVLQRYDGSTWESVAVVIEGEKGDNAPSIKIQYSVNGSSGWTENIDITVHKYWRWSSDNGISWSPNYVKFSGDGSGTSVPEPYSMSVGNNGKLQLFKEGALIQEQDETGSWIVNAVATGTGSLHVGDLHSIGSGGENIVFLNTDSNIAWFPSWSGISVDGTQSLEMTARTHSAITTAEPAGTINTSGSVPYTDTFTALLDVAFFSVDIVPAETFNGRLRWISNKSTGKELAAFFIDVNFVEGVETSLQFKYPLWTQAGQTFTVELTKDDGTLFNVRPSLTQATKPWRRTHFRGYTDHLVFHEANAELQAIALNALTGTDRLSAASIRDYPVMSSAQLGMAKLGTTMSIDVSGELNTVISPTGIKEVSDETARLLIPVSGGAILAIQQDNGFTYGIEAGEDTSVAGNWKRIGTNVEGTGGGTFDTTLPDSQTSTESIGNISVGTTVSSLRGRTFTSIFEEALFPLQFANLSEPPFIDISGFSTSLVEVGTTYTPTIVPTFEQGLIFHGTGAIAGPVVGEMDFFSVINPDGASVPDSAAPWSVVATAYTFTNTGSRSWTMVASHPAGTTVYTDGAGNIVPSSTIDNAMSATTTSRSSTKSAAFKRFTHMGARGSSPTETVGVRGSSSDFLSISSTANYVVVVPAGTSEFSLYVPQGKTVSFLNTNTNAVMDVPPTSILVNDASATPQNYNKFTINLGLNGFPTDFNLQVGVA